METSCYSVIICPPSQWPRSILLNSDSDSDLLTWDSDSYSPTSFWFTNLIWSLILICEYDFHSDLPPDSDFDSDSLSCLTLFVCVIPRCPDLAIFVYTTNDITDYFTFCTYTQYSNDQAAGSCSQRHKLVWESKLQLLLLGICTSIAAQVVDASLASNFTITPKKNRGNWEITFVCHARHKIISTGVIDLGPLIRSDEFYK